LYNKLDFIKIHVAGRL